MEIIGIRTTTPNGLLSVENFYQSRCRRPSILYQLEGIIYTLMGGSNTTLGVPFEQLIHNINNSDSLRNMLRSLFERELYRSALELITPIIIEFNRTILEVPFGLQGHPIYESQTVLYKWMESICKNVCVNQLILEAKKSSSREYFLYNCTTEEEQLILQLHNFKGINQYSEQGIIDDEGNIIPYDITPQFRVTNTLNSTILLQQPHQVITRKNYSK